MKWLYVIQTSEFANIALRRRKGLKPFYPIIRRIAFSGTYATIGQIRVNLRLSGLVVEVDGLFDELDLSEIKCDDNTS